jgi:photosystem II stability/assembly factor-like uncharacterized protein
LHSGLSKSIDDGRGIRRAPLRWRDCAIWLLLSLHCGSSSGGLGGGTVVDGGALGEGGTALGGGERGDGSLLEGAAADGASGNGDADRALDASHVDVVGADSADVEASDTGVGLRESGVDSAPVVPDAAGPCSSITPPTGAPPALTPGQWVSIAPPGQMGFQDVHVLPCSPYVLYVVSLEMSLMKSSDGGATWANVGNLPSPVSLGVMQIDPKNPLTMYYGGGVRDQSLGFWISTDGGDTWNQPPSFLAQADNSADGWVNDVYDVAADPTDFGHVLVSFHSPWNFGSDAGIIESRDGGQTWIRHPPMAGWSTGESISFLGNSTTWLLGTQPDGFWRTTDSGATWTQVSTYNGLHGACHPFFAPDGTLYVGANNQMLRSSDRGMSFMTIPGLETPDGYYDVISDGNLLYAHVSNVVNGLDTVGDQPYIVSPVADGTSWKPYNSQTFNNGPYRFAFDPVNRIVYSANWDNGLWALKVMP